jgi:hypothetical protein
VEVGGQGMSLDLRGRDGSRGSLFSALSWMLFIAYPWSLQLHVCRRASAHLQVKYPTTNSVSRVSVSFIISPSSYIAFQFEYPRSISIRPIIARARHRKLARQHGSKTRRGRGSDPVSLHLNIRTQACGTNKKQLCRYSLLLWPAYSEASPSPI